MSVPAKDIQILIQLAGVFVALVLNWKLIKVAVVREYFCTLPRSLLAALSCGHVLTTFSNLAIAISGRVEIVESAQEKFQNLNALMECIINFVTLFYLIDNFIGTYKNLFQFYPVGSFLFVSGSMVTSFICFLIPEFYYSNMNSPPSQYISISLAFLNLLLNLVVYFKKRSESAGKLGKVNLNARFQISEARESTLVILPTVTFRLIIVSVDIIYNQFLMETFTDYHRIAEMILRLLTTAEAIVLPSVFIQCHASILHHYKREEHSKSKTHAPLLPRKRYDGNPMVKTLTQDETFENMHEIWMEEYRKKMKGKKNRKQKAESVSKQKLLNEASRETLE